MWEFIAGRVRLMIKLRLNSTAVRILFEVLGYLPGWLAVKLNRQFVGGVHPGIIPIF
jgi:hypothetical protein